MTNQHQRGNNMTHPTNKNRLEWFNLDRSMIEKYDAYLVEHGISQHDFCRLAGLNPQTMTSIVARVMDRGKARTTRTLFGGVIKILELE